MEQVSVSPTSRNSALSDEIILRETTITRLVFRPLIINNIHDAKASVKGTFIFQRKNRKDEWEDHRDLSLSNLKATEWIKLELKSDELLILISSINELYNLHAQEGIPKQKAQFIKVESHINALLQADKKELLRILEIEKEGGLQVFLRLLDWFAKIENREQIVNRLESLESDGLQKLNTLIGIGSLKTALAVWNENKDNSSEEFWQKTLSKFSFVLSQIFSFPVIVLKDKAYVGGKSIENTHGNLVDFLMANKLTRNAALIEIKTPKTPIVGKQYRGDINSIENEVIGAVMQVTNYRDSLLKQFNTLTSGATGDFDAFDPQCLVIVGNMQNEKMSRLQRKSFELFRNGLKDVRVITYDELFTKVQILIDLLEGNMSDEIFTPSEEFEVPV